MFSFFTRSDLVAKGFDEDGSQVVAEFHYVVAESSDGRRWAHFFRSPDADAVVRLLDRVSAAGAPADFDRWSPIDARYGSASHDERALYDEDDLAIRRRAF